MIVQFGAAQQQRRNRQPGRAAAGGPAGQLAGEAGAIGFAGRPRSDRRGSRFRGPCCWPGCGRSRPRRPDRPRPKWRAGGIWPTGRPVAGRRFRAIVADRRPAARRPIPSRSKSPRRRWSSTMFMASRFPGGGGSQEVGRDDGPTPEGVVHLRRRSLQNLDSPGICSAFKSRLASIRRWIKRPLAGGSVRKPPGR